MKALWFIVNRGSFTQAHYWLVGRENSVASKRELDRLAT